MRRHHVGDIVVVDFQGGRQVPVGIVTDRDIVVEILAMNLNSGDFTVGDIMSTELVTLRDDASVYEAIQTMRTKGVRRMPLVDAEGELTGIVSTDDLLPLITEELTDLTKLILGGRTRECELRR
jgi:CBS domain-containing protein